SRVEDSFALFHEAVRLANAVDERDFVATVGLELAGNAPRIIERGDSVRWAMAGFEILSSCGKTLEMAAVAGEIGELAMTNGQLDVASHWYTKSLEISQASSNQSGAAIAYDHLAIVSLLQRCTDDARRLFTASRDEWAQLGHSGQVA